MWKAKLYIGTSIIDSIIQKDRGTSYASRRLLNKCKKDAEYEAYVSPFTILELFEKYDAKKQKSIINLLNEYDIRVIKYLLPKEIDYLVKLYEQNKILLDDMAYDYYHIATCSYLNLEYYLSWNAEDLVNFETYKKVMNSHIPRGYRSMIQFRSPEYFANVQKSAKASGILTDSEPIKKRLYGQITQINKGEQAKWVEETALAAIKGKLEIIELPEELHQAARIPTLEISDIQLKFNVFNYEEDIKRKVIPLLDLDYDSTGMDVYFEMLRLDVIEGAEELKNRQLALNYFLPTRYTIEEKYKIDKERNKKFIDWILPQIKNGIDNSERAFTEIHPDWIKRYNYREIDQELANSISGNDLEKIKTKALELNKFIVQKSWQYYQGFSFSGIWCHFNEYAEHGEYTHIIVEKDGKEIWVILINEEF